MRKIHFFVKYAVTSLMIATCLLIEQASAARRGFVVGVSSYSEDNLPEVAKDAEAVAAALSQLGFSLLDGKAHLNLSRESMRDAAARFIASLQPGDTALFYYSGHGIEALGENYLVSSDGQRGIAVGEDILDAMGLATNGPKIIILDTCRKPGASEPGLSRPGIAPLNSIVIYGSPPKRSIAYPSKYTKALLARIEEPGLEVIDLLRSAKEALVIAAQASGQSPQQPAEYGGLTEKFYFRPAAGITIQMRGADDDLKVLVNDEQQASWRTDRSKPKRVLLKPGSNTLELRVHNWRTFTGGVPQFGGHRAEGWNYDVAFFDDSGKELGVLTDREAWPKADGPRHGQEFLAARGIVDVDAKTGAVSLRAKPEPR